MRERKREQDKRVNGRIVRVTKNGEWEGEKEEGGRREEERERERARQRATRPTCLGSCGKGEGRWLKAKKKEGLLCCSD
jgi:hypothetical protein